MAFLVVGEALVDLIGDAGSWRFDAAPGGSPLNVAVGLAAAGHPVRLAAEVGDDLFGGYIRDHLKRHGVVETDLRTTDTPTNLAFARVGADGVAGYDFRFGWTWTGPAALDRVECLHTGSLAAALAPGADAVAETVAAARERGITVSFDPNVRPSLLPDRDDARARVERLVALADIVKVSSEDLAWLYPGAVDVSVARKWSEQGPWLVVVTRGGDGAVALARGYAVECLAPPIRMIDTVGAGDTFMAGLLSYLAPTFGDPDGADVTGALRHASAAAAAVCTRRGADPPPADIVAALLDQARIRRLHL